MSRQETNFVLATASTPKRAKIIPEVWLELRLYGHASEFCYDMGDKRKAIQWWDQEIAVMMQIVGEDHPRYQTIVNGRNNLEKELTEAEALEEEEEPQEGGDAEKMGQI
ncbi:hypothetical protein EG328_009022 [Venturia inaequalis]|nr:hypothetical protein EG328_009022 [Venturia inaequalis]RDI88073.1 hypothetical protein Vi05172_g1677 [Venturia inaequalis]